VVLLALDPEERCLGDVLGKQSQWDAHQEEAHGETRTTPEVPGMDLKIT